MTSRDGPLTGAIFLVLFGSGLSSIQERKRWRSLPLSAFAKESLPPSGIARLGGLSPSRPTAAARAGPLGGVQFHENNTESLRSDPCGRGGKSRQMLAGDGKRQTES
jgi:hypothetical protein